MTTLRDRRRLQTARDIQSAALRLSLRIGYAAVTTDSIASEAEISARTFFNYYPNKQAAMLGPPPQLDSCNVDWIVTSQGSLIDDLTCLFTRMLEVKQPDRQVVRMIEKVWQMTPELMTVFRNSMDHIALTIGGVLQARLGPERQTEATLIAELATHALAHALRLWAADDTISEAEIPGMIRGHMQNVCTLLT